MLFEVSDDDEEVLVLSDDDSDDLIVPSTQPPPAAAPNCLCGSTATWEDDRWMCAAYGGKSCGYEAAPMDDELCIDEPPICGCGLRAVAHRRCLEKASHAPIFIAGFAHSCVQANWACPNAAAYAPVFIAGFAGSGACHARRYL